MGHKESNQTNKQKASDNFGPGEKGSMYFITLEVNFS